MNASINLILGCHSHQPIGNFPDVFEQSYDLAYKPFVDVLERFPAVKCTLHYTGPLLDWFLDNRPDFIKRLRDLVERGQVEIMGGAYYEPLLCAIPERDSVSQIRRMTAFCEEHFGQAPRGMWLTERVWEPHMPRILRESGIEYTALDDAHFLASGLKPQDMFGYYVTEDEGLAVKVFPILESLRYGIPFHPVEESIEFLRRNATDDGLRCAVIHDDGEKFGVWPETHHSVYTEGWLERFFQALTDNQEWLRCMTYAEYMAHAPAQGRTYLTCASYDEMNAWALPADMQRTLHHLRETTKHDPKNADAFALFLKGGFWRSFLGKYPESNNIQKRMLYISRRVLAARRKFPDDPRIEEAETFLHQGQCNCAYWHGVFGGLYLNHLRTALYDRLIHAERLLDTMEHPETGWVHCEAQDFDADGLDEIIVTNSKLWLGIAPNDGGTLFELDFKPKPFNFLNTLARRDEFYHDQLRGGMVQVGNAEDEEHQSLSIHDLVRAKEANLEQFLVLDPYRRASLRDRVLGDGVTVEQLWSNTAPNRAAIATQAYEYEVLPDGVRLRCEAVLDEEPGRMLRVEKLIRVAADASSVEVRYDVASLADHAVTAIFGTEIAVNLLAGRADDRYYRSDERDMGRVALAERGEDDDLTHIALRDDWQALEFGIHLDRAARVFRFPIETVSQSEGGQERIYQGSVVLPSWSLTWEPGQTHSLGLTLTAAETG